MTSGQYDETDHADVDDRQMTGHLCSGIAQVGLAVAEFSLGVFDVELGERHVLDVVARVLRLDSAETHHSTLRLSRPDPCK